MSSKGSFERLKAFSNCTNLELLSKSEVRAIFWRNANRYNDSEDLQSQAFILWLEMRDVRSNSTKCFAQYLTSAIRHCVSKADVFRKRKKRNLPVSQLYYTDTGRVLEPQGRLAGIYFTVEEKKQLQKTIRNSVKVADPKFLVKVLDCMLGCNDAKEFSKANNVHYNKYHNGKSRVRRIMESFVKKASAA